MNELIVKDVKIENMIYEVRGKQVMLDSDLAKLYECKNGTKMINQSVKRNKERFPEDFYFQITREEYNEILRSQNVTLELERGKYSKYLPYVFTEQGVSMLSSVLKTEKASGVSISIMRAFVAMRKYISTELLEQRYINNQVMKNTEDIKLLKETFTNFKTFSNEIFFEGQIYDAYSLLLDIFNISNKSIVIIDNYISKSLLDILSKTNKKITIYTKNIDNNLINKYNSQYHNVKVLINNSFHDRFIIIDNKVLYHCGASFKDLGKKCFAINKIDDKEILCSILNIL
ncbi:MAG: ORF6N domain-containing protein [Bacilli bacterium]